MRKILSAAFIAAIVLYGISCREELLAPNDFAKATLVVDTVPEGARIWLDGRVTNKTTPDSLTNLEIGLHNITLIKPGYRDTVVRTEVIAGRHQMIKVRLNPGDK